MGRKASPSSPRNYFTKETEEYVVKYNTCVDPVEKQRIFTEHLYFPFYKLAECIIHTFKFRNHIDTENVEDLKLDIISMIYQEKLGGFDATRGSKAFSYFGTIIKRWLIAYCNSNYQREKTHYSVDSYENYLVDGEIEFEETDQLSLSNFMDRWVEDVSSRLSSMFMKDQDKQIAEAVLTVFRDRKNTNLLFQKKALYVYVREMTHYETPYITKVVRKLKEDFYIKFRPLVEEGLIDLDLSS